MHESVIVYVSCDIDLLGMKWNKNGLVGWWYIGI